MRFNDAILGLLLVIFAIAEIAYSTTFPTLHGQAYGPSLFPILIGCGLLVCGLVLIVRGLHMRRQQAATTTSAQLAADSSNNKPYWIQLDAWAADPVARMNILLVPLSLLAYILLSDLVGFIPLSIIILTTLLFRLGSSLTTSIIIAVLTTGVLQLLFAKVLLVPLPSGLLLRWLG